MCGGIRGGGQGKAVAGIKILEWRLQQRCGQIWGSNVRDIPKLPNGVDLSQQQFCDNLRLCYGL